MKNFPEIKIPETIMERYNYTYEDCCNMPLILLKFLQQNVTGRYESLDD